jgi:hypothetical protein
VSPRPSLPSSHLLSLFLFRSVEQLNSDLQSVQRAYRNYQRRLSDAVSGVGGVSVTSMGRGLSGGLKCVCVCEWQVTLIGQDQRDDNMVSDTHSVVNAMGWPLEG